jgi:alpha-beta hydrolase superfamily lysophospholipase
MSRRDEGFFSSKDGTRLFWRSLQPDGAPSALVAVVHGYGDHSGRYQRVMADLVDRGLAAIAFDYRGHGKADGARADVGAWADYLDDMDAFFRKAKEVAAGKPVFVLAHSNGALIVTHWVAQKPEGLAGVILTSPFYALAFTPPALKLLGARLIKGVLPGLSIGNELKAEQLSRDPTWQQETAADPLYLHNTTPRWFFETQAAQARLTGLGAAVTGPVLFLAGGADPVASTPTAKGFFDTVAAPDKTWKAYPDFRHEILNEVGREEVIADIAQWISAHR